MNKETELAQQIAALQAKQEAAGNRVGNVLNIAITLATGRHAADDNLTVENTTVAYWRGFVAEAEAIYDNISGYIDAHLVPKARADIEALDGQIKGLMQEREATMQRSKLMGGSPKKVVTLN